MEKDFKTDVSVLSPDENDMELINRFSRKKLTADDVYTFSVLLCDNEIDRDFERFDIEALKTLSEMFVGKTGIADHSMKSGDQTSRVYKTELIVSSDRNNSLGEPYAYIKAMAYMPRNEKNASLIADIDAGIKKEASVGCAVKRVICSVCGEDMRKSGCDHIKGKTYGGKLCHAVLTEPTDAYEWSFVAVPAQKAAGVVKNFKPEKEEKGLEDILKALKSEEGPISLSVSEVKTLRKSIESLEKDAIYGKMYLSELTDETVRLGLCAMPFFDGDQLRDICEKLSVNELRSIKKGFAEFANKKFPMDIQLNLAETPSAENNEFKI
ncbi:MAG: hypothetical protein K6F09_05660 [Clostridiales bacterium]|nr:hypothetical protein [Clostridiales bacterium]